MTIAESLKDRQAQATENRAALEREYVESLVRVMSCSGTPPKMLVDAAVSKMGPLGYPADRAETDTATIRRTLALETLREQIGAPDDGWLHDQIRLRCSKVVTDATKMGEIVNAVKEAPAIDPSVLISAAAEIVRLRSKLSTLQGIGEGHELEQRTGTTLLQVVTFLLIAGPGNQEKKHQYLISRGWRLIGAPPAYSPPLTYGLDGLFALEGAFSVERKRTVEPMMSAMKDAVLKT